MSHARGGAACALALLLGAGFAWAEAPRRPERGAAELRAAPGAEDEYSAYELDVILEQMRALGARPEPAPEGKQIESIEVVTLDVFDERDPVPDFVNVFHVTSRKHVIRRELLFDEGERYSQSRVDESARNLRDIRQLSLVLIVPMRGKRADRVRVLVITKDVWSLRLNSNFEADASLTTRLVAPLGDVAPIMPFYLAVPIPDVELTTLLLNPSEENLFGTHNSIGGLFILRPDTYSVGGLLSNPRVFGSRIQANLGASAIFNRESGATEGSFGHFFYGQPLYSLSTKWAWKTAVVWRQEITRRYGGLDLLYFDGVEINALCTATNPRCVPIVYSSERQASAIELVRSFGRQYKHDISVGVEADRRLYRPPDLDAYDPGSARAFVSEMVPLSDTRISPFLQLRDSTSRFLRVLDFNTLALQEDYRLGHEVILRVYPASSDLGSTRDMLGTLAALSYTWPAGDGLIRILGASTVEFELEGRHDALIELAARLATPRLGFGRFVYDGVLLNRYHNYLNTLYRVGGDGRLRGFKPLDQFVGKDVIANNVEFRSRPVDILSAQLGGALFYDAANAFNGFSNVRLMQSVGAGVRILFPQVNRFVFRIDWGFPLTPTRISPTFPGAAFITFGQAFSMPALSPPTITSAFEELN